MKKVLLVLIFILIAPHFICQESVIDSADENYLSYTRSNFAVGYQSQFTPTNENSHLIFALSYSISNFFYSIRESKNQIGLFNEIGVNNLSVYAQAGPELRLLESIYIIPKIGVAFAWMPGAERSGIGLLYFYGGNVGYIFSPHENLSFYLEGGVDFIPNKGTEGINYLKLGVSFDLF